MSEYTSTLNLFKYDTAADGKEVFSIDKSLNENWDKLDAFAAGIKSLSNLSPEGENRFTQINTELSKKLEADVLLAENGYIKFNNKLLIQWGGIPQKTSTLSIIFCVAFNVQKLYINVALEDLSGSSYTWEVWHSPTNITKTSFSIYSDSNGRNSQRRYFAIGF